MSSFQYINISLEAICCAVCTIILFCGISAEYNEEKLYRIFTSIVSVTILLILVDIVIFAFEGSTGPYIGLIFRAAYFLSFVLGSVLLVLFTLYFLTLIRMKTAVSKNTALISYTAIVICALNISAVVLTLFFGLYYYIDDNNIFHDGDFYLLSQASAIACMLINTGLVVAHRKSFTKRELVFLLSYVALPMLAIFVQNIAEGTIASIDVATTLTILIFYAGIQSEQAKRLKQKELELLESRIEVMLSQIKPHFLYNALNTIDNLYYDSPDKGHESMLAFSEYLRGNMDALSQRKLIPFQMELEHAKQYLLLEKLRFEERLQIIYDIGNDGFMLPALTLQPIVENAVRHGITKQSMGGVITLRTAETDSCFRIIITDNGVGFDPTANPNDGHTHIGIANVRNRLLAMCGGRLTIESAPGVGTTVIIEIPKRKEPLK